MPIVNSTEWSAFLAIYPDAHILQGARWGILKGQFGWEAVQFINGTTGAQVLIRQLPMGLRMAYIPMGPIGEDWPALLGEIDDYCFRNRIFLLKIEPDEGMDPLEVTIKVPGIIHSPQTIQPRRSIVIDLSGDKEALLARMKQKTRYNIGLATKKGVTVKIWDDLSGFHQMMQMTGERDTFGIHSLEYYKQAYELFHPEGACELLAAFHEGAVLAALMVFSAGKRAWYFYGASGNQKRHLMPTYLLQWEAMLWAKSKGCTRYDLWGVPDHDEDYLENHFNDRQDGLWGVYRFKRGFGGSLVRSAGAFDRVYHRSMYFLYTLYIRLFRRIE
jgi:lipid II:glycine glycyltransferase (peptidoglycan interpeptide bridge formation enzyme)